MNILWYPHVGYRAQFFLRHVWPARELAKHGYGVKVKDPRMAPSHYTPEQMTEDFAWADVVVVFYPKSPNDPIMLEVCEMLDNKLVIDLDDYVLGAVHHTNPAYQFSGLKDIYDPKTGKPLWQDGIHYSKEISMKNHLRTLEMIKRADAMTVTTPVLADFYAPFAQDMWILPNSLYLPLYKPWKRRAPREEVRIGWQGGASHYSDIKMITPILKEVLDTYPQAKFVLLGQYEGQVFEELGDRVEFHPWVESEAYPLKLGSLDLDIGICPIEDNTFNKGKSNLKQIEYGAFSVPSVCSAIQYGPYNYPEGVTEHGIDGMLVEDNDPQEWFDCLSHLILHESDRREMGARMREKVENLYNIEETWVEWRKCYETVNSGLLGTEGFLRTELDSGGPTSDRVGPGTRGEAQL